MPQRGVMSINNIPIRLPAERWKHIVTRHPELKGLRSQVSTVIRSPELIVIGSQGEHIAARRESDKQHWLVVIYRQGLSSGFVITAFRARKISHLKNRPTLWHQEPS